MADAQYLFCSLALGEKNPGLDIEHTKTSKADLVAALNTAFAYCDKAYDSMTDASASQTIKLFGNDAPRMSALIVNNMHNMEHYGNLVTYMRIKGIVPPSSEQPPDGASEEISESASAYGEEERPHVRPCGVSHGRDVSYGCVV